MEQRLGQHVLQGQYHEGGGEGTPALGSWHTKGMGKPRPQRDWKWIGTGLCRACDEVFI